MNQTTQKTEFELTLSSIHDVKEFLSLTGKIPNLIDVVQGRYTVSGKSIMGLFSLDLERPVRVSITGELNPAFAAEFERFGGSDAQSRLATDDGRRAAPPSQNSSDCCEQSPQFRAGVATRLSSCSDALTQSRLASSATENKSLLAKNAAPTSSAPVFSLCQPYSPAPGGSDAL